MAELTSENVEYLIVHCSATPPKMDIGVKEIDRWHRQRGWLGCGYHLVIRRDGTVEKGRPITQPGAHVRGFNHSSIGVCLVGGVDEKNKPEANFTEAQYESLRRTLDSLFETFHKAVLRGHRDMPEVHKACPSFDCQPWYFDPK